MPVLEFDEQFDLWPYEGQYYNHPKRQTHDRKQEFHEGERGNEIDQRRAENCTSNDAEQGPFSFEHSREATV
jgi:hypothetical protein